MTSRIELSDDKDLIGPWVFRRLKCFNSWAPEGRQALGLVRNGEVLGGVVFENATGASVMGHLALASKHVPVRRLFSAAFHYVFMDLGYEKFLGMVNSSNQPSLKLLYRVGFRPHAVVEGVFPDGDLVIMVANRSECRWIPEAYRTAA